MTTTALNLETVKMISEAAAREVGDKVATVLRDEIRQSFNTLESGLTTRIELTLDKYFGDMRPADHIIEHEKLRQDHLASQENKRTFAKSMISSTSKVLASILAGLVIFYAGAKYNIHIPMP